MLPTCRLLATWSCQDTAAYHTAAHGTWYGDQWRSYNGVPQLPNVSSHRTVNHSVKFVDSVTGVHTQNNIESYWNRVKMKLKRMKGCGAEEILGYLDEFMWRERFVKIEREALDGIMHDISQQYPVKSVSTIPSSPSPNHFYRFFSKPQKNKRFTFAKIRQRCQLYTECDWLKCNIN